MKETDVKQILQVPVNQETFALLILADDTDDLNFDEIAEVLETIEIEGDSGTFLVLKESDFIDFKTLSLDEMLALQRKLENAINKRVNRSVVGDA